MADSIVFRPIGIIHTGFASRVNMPIQPAFSQAAGKVEVFPEFAAGLKDLDGFSHIYLVYQFNRSDNYRLLVRPYLDETERGLFATRAPARPNQIGISVVRLERIENNILYVYSVDILDNTPLLDIKPYIKGFDIVADAKEGWIDGRVNGRHIADTRFGK